MRPALLALALAFAFFAGREPEGALAAVIAVAVWATSYRNK